MRIWLGVTLLLSATVACAFTPPIQASLSLEGTTTVGQAVDVYNKGSQDKAAFALLEAEFGQGEEGALPLKFTIKETLCLKAQRQNPQKCDFKDDGLVKTCSASLLKERDQPALVVICDSVTIPPFRSKRSMNVHDRSNGNGRKTKKRKCQKGTKCENPVRPGMFAVLSKVEEDTPILQTNSSGSNQNGRRPKGKKCTAGMKCKKRHLRIQPGKYSTAQGFEPSSADKKPLRAKRSPNTNGSSKGNGRKPTNPKCRAGNKCEKEPQDFNTGRWSTIAHVPQDSVSLLATAHVT